MFRYRVIFRYKVMFRDRVMFSIIKRLILNTIIFTYYILFYM